MRGTVAAARDAQPGLVRNDDHRASRVIDEVLGHATQNAAVEPAEAASADHDRGGVAVVGDAREGLVRLAADTNENARPAR